VKSARLVLSDAAVADILEQADWYLARSGPALAARWEKAVTSAILRALKNPASGAPCRFHPSELRNVRRTTIRGFPKHLLFYRIRGTEVLVLRIVHGARDLEKLF
jgi:toxin ParE1/3/4